MPTLHESSEYTEYIYKALTNNEEGPVYKWNPTKKVYEYSNTLFPNKNVVDVNYEIIIEEKINSLFPSINNDNIVTNMSENSQKDPKSEELYKPKKTAIAYIQMFSKEINSLHFPAEDINIKLDDLSDDMKKLTLRKEYQQKSRLKTITESQREQIKLRLKQYKLVEEEILKIKENIEKKPAKGSDMTDFISDYSKHLIKLKDLLKTADFDEKIEKVRKERSN